LAEGMAGSEEEFVNTLNDTADELGMDSTHFANASGWPDPDQYSTAMDLAILAEKTIENFPQYYHWYDRTEFTYNEITQNNRNPLLYEVEGADGLKTGHTQEAGYGLTGSVKRGDRRLIVVLNGLPSRRARATESERLIEWGFRNFDPVTVFEEGETVIDGKVWRGRRSTIPLVTNQEIRISIHRRDRRALNVTAIHHDPLPAPVEAEEQVGTLRISAPNLVAQEYPLFAGESVGPQGFLGRAMSAANYLVFGHSS
jgi:D-alanyl-D-alanine carboxypeptidase (penicillin-binding protein 5/6)